MIEVIIILTIMLLLIGAISLCIIVAIKTYSIKDKGMCVWLAIVLFGALLLFISTIQ